MKNKKSQEVNLKNIDELLSQQTVVILDAVDEKISKVDGKILRLEIGMSNLEARLDKKLEKMELRIDQKFDRITTTLDRFFKGLTNMETDFEMMRLDINRMKKIIKEKLGVDLYS